MDEKPRWFIKTLNVFTKDVICQSLQELNQVAELTRIVDGEGIPHKVWEVDYLTITYLQKSQKQIPTEFIVFMQKGDIVQKWELHKYSWPMSKKSKKKRSAENQQTSKNHRLH